MFKRIRIVVTALLLAAGLLPAGEMNRRITNETRWLCYYGNDRRVLDVEGYELLILESEGVGELTPEDKKGRLCVAYMSIGEAEHGRWYWPIISEKNWILETNPDWPESRLVDPRSEEWREMVVDVIAASLISLGYDGFILDNVDTAETLLEENPEKYKGADAATADIIKRLRQKYPDSIIIANGGLSIVPRVADQVDAMMYEGTLSTWRPDGKGGYRYAMTSSQSRAWLNPRLGRIKGYRLPILALEYVDPGNPTEYQRIWDMVKRAGNNPFISVRALDVFPGSDKLPPLDDDDGGGDEGEEKD